MTVNELIAELQVLVAQGHGELDVAVHDNEDAQYNIATSVDKAKGINKIDYYVYNYLSSHKEQDFVVIS